MGRKSARNIWRSQPSLHGVFSMPTNPEILAALNGLGKFKILDEILEGANAHAFKAFHSHLEREVFLKVFYLGDAAADLALREPRLLVQATQSGNCSNIIRVFEADVFRIRDDDYVCLQMEYVEGGSILNRLRTNEIGQQDAVRIATQILQGVHHLHHLRFVHRDLKPANIVITSCGVPKIADFGSIARIPEASDHCSASKHSILYVPPEAMDGRYTFASDLYQLGMVLYEMVNGPMDYRYVHYILPKDLKRLANEGTPYDSLDVFEQARLNRECIKKLSKAEKLLDHGRPPGPQFSPRLKRLIRTATHPDLRKRFATALEFHSKLLQLKLPNWKITNDQFIALDWRTWDWRLYFRKRRNGDESVLERARTGTSNYRRVATRPFNCLQGIFQFVENFQV